MEIINNCYLRPARRGIVLQKKNMKAAVINGFGEVPQYGDFPDPSPVDGEVLIDIKASVLENFDKGTVSGKHYSSKTLYPQFPAIVGTDGIGMTPDGKMVAFGRIRAPYGAFAERTVAGYTVPVPDGIDAARASAIPSSVLTSLLPLKYSAKLQLGETVLVNGATGVSGRMAIQIAKMLGAGKVIATGRNEGSLALLPGLGADVMVDLKQSDEQVAGAFKDAAGEKGIDVVLDFIWGHPAEVLIGTFIPTEVGFAKRRVRYLQIGQKAGSHISLPASALRTSGLELMGIGKIPFEIVQEEMKQVWSWIADEKIDMEIEEVPLADIASAWQRDDLEGKRLVIIPT
jgi:NADPH:quinone reductase-like Zn-dependent oxidoreductase